MDFSTEKPIKAFLPIRWITLRSPPYPGNLTIIPCKSNDQSFKQYSKPLRKQNVYLSGWL